MNLSFCSKCGKKVEVKHVQRDGREYLEKLCPDCGSTYVLVSSDNAMYARKRNMMRDQVPTGCDLNCLNCHSHRQPNVVFVETTNRCNMNCPICITNVPSMGFEFEPDMEYFDRIFKFCASFEDPPSIQLFGGEPTVREDLFEIISLARSYGLTVRLVTNGLKLADKDYCDKIMKSGASVLISFDGLKRELYEKLRGSAASMDLKLKALENISGHKKGKVILMTVIDKELNGDDMERFLEYCFENSRIVRGIFPMPLTQVWSESKLDYRPERTTPEDVEKIVDKAVEGKVEFVPLGSLEFKHLAKLFRVNHMPFLGVHPNCESFTLLVNNGKKFVSVNNFLKKGAFSFVEDLRALDKRAEKAVKKGGSMFFPRAAIALSLGALVIRNADSRGLVGASGFKAFGRWMKMAFEILCGKKPKKVFKDHTGLRGILQVLILPFEHDDTLESERLQICSSGYAYIDEKTDSIKLIPTCIWDRFKDECLRSNAVRFNKPGYGKGLAQGAAPTTDRG